MKPTFVFVIGGLLLLTGNAIDGWFVIAAKHQQIEMLLAQFVFAVGAIISVFGAVLMLAVRRRIQEAW